MVAYLEHDDLWLAEHLQRLTRAIDQGADLVYGLTERVYPDNAKPCGVHYEPAMWIAPSCVVHRRELALTVGGWKHYHETPIEPESDLWLRFHNAGAKIRVVPMPFESAAAVDLLTLS